MIIKLLTPIPDGTKIDFFGHRFYGFLLTAIVILGSLFCLATKGLNFGVDFTGGTVIEIQVRQDPNLAALRTELNELDLGEISIQEFGSTRDLMIRLPQQKGDEATQKAAIETVRTTLQKSHADMGIEFRRVEYVGPQVGDELKKAALIAIFLSILGIMSYIWFRFEWQYGVGSITALIHDVVGTLGLFSITQMQFDLSTLAAVLLVAGYSINDTVIIYDRIRENLRKFKKMPVPELLNLSINQTLARTIVTSTTTLLAIAALWLFGGEVIRGFVVALFFGIAIGTHSSYFVATPILHYLNVRRSAREGGSESPAAPSSSKA